jgi:hypothetical protein
VISLRAVGNQVFAGGVAAHVIPSAGDQRRQPQTTLRTESLHALQTLAVAALAVLASGCATRHRRSRAAPRARSWPWARRTHRGRRHARRPRERLDRQCAVDQHLNSNKTFYYRFAWLGAEGFPVAEEEVWKAR